MKHFLLSVLAVTFLLMVPLAQAQPASTVQLPTFSQFTVQTTVVPDRGGIVLGGVDRGVDSTVNRGPPRNRGISSTRAASGMSISATIVDHSELDRAVLAEAAAKRGATDPALAKARALARAGSAASPPESVAVIRERTATAAELESAELAGYFAKGSQAESEGKSAVAKIFYDMVARRDKGPLKQQAISRLAAINTNSAASTKR